MHSVLVTQNMFPEIPSDAFDYFHSNRCFCYICYNTMNRHHFYIHKLSICNLCNDKVTFLKIFLKKYIKGYVVRQKIKKIHLNRLMSKWFLTKGVFINNITRHIITFL